ncbi:MAG TPA: VOC family protein [Acidimicrobiales bacterium]|nr:VOC family protein [Acidimicrobiales bacterium]
MTVTGIAHTGVCVADVDEAVAWYRDVLGMTVLSPPYLVSGESIRRDMGEMVPGLSLKAAIVGFDRSDHVLEILEYPATPGTEVPRRLNDRGISHVGLLCDDLAATRAELEGRGVRFLTAGLAGIAGLRTTWFVDPYGTVFILIQKEALDRPYWRQPASSDG